MARRELLENCDDPTRAIVPHAGSVVYSMRAAVLACAGIPTRIGRQYQFGPVSLEDYEQIALIEHPDPPARKLPAERQTLGFVGNGQQHQATVPQAAPPHPHSTVRV